MASLHDSHDVSIIFFFFFYGIAMGSLKVFHGILLDFYDVAMGFKRRFLWDVHDVSMIVLWDSYGIPIGFP